MALSFSAACLTDTGKIRAANQDNFLFDQLYLEEVHQSMALPFRCAGSLIRPRLFALFDGMGGESFGDIASGVAAKTAQELEKKLTRAKDVPTALEEACTEINSAVVARGRELLCDRMGSTLSMLLLSGRNAHVCNIGDSRIFILRKGVLTQLSRDHTDAEMLEKLGIHRRPRLIQHLGMDPEETRLEPHIVSFRLERGDLCLLCSDGVTDMVTEETLQSLLAEDPQPDRLVRTLVDRSLEAGGRDNITAIVCRIL